MRWIHDSNFAKMTPILESDSCLQPRALKRTEETVSVARLSRDGWAKETSAGGPTLTGLSRRGIPLRNTKVRAGRLRRKKIVGRKILVRSGMGRLLHVCSFLRSAGFTSWQVLYGCSPSLKTCLAGPDKQTYSTDEARLPRRGSLWGCVSRIRAA